MTTGNAVIVEAADILAQNSPSDVLNDTMKTDNGAAFVIVKLKAMKNSFQVKIKHSSNVAIKPGMARGRITRVNSCSNVPPSIRAASRISKGKSARNERIIQI